MVPLDPHFFHPSSSRIEPGRVGNLLPTRIQFGMSHYRRANASGGTYFFTVTYRRQTFLCDDDVRSALRAAIQYVREQYPFQIDAWVLLLDHLHCLWTLPTDGADFSLVVSSLRARRCVRAGLGWRCD